MISPSTIDKHVDKLLDILDAQYEPEFIQIIAESYSKPANCFNNVSTKIKKDGGKIRYGWAILKTQFIYEAEWHAVWENESEDLVDITPRSESDKQILFLPTDTIEYSGEFIDNVRLNPSTNIIIDDFIFAAEKYEKLCSYGKRINDDQLSLTPNLANGANSLNNKKNSLLGLLLQGKSGTSKCYCNSGQLYKGCHGKKMKESILKIFNEHESVHLNEKSAR